MTTKSLNSRIRRLYESQYKEEEYSPGWYKRLGRYSPSREDVAYNIARSYSGKILDVGCGEGKLLRRLSSLFDELVGIDLVKYRIKAGIKLNRKLKLRNIILESADIENGLVFRKENFDVVVCLGVLEYIFDPEFTLQEIRRVLKHKGMFVLQVPNVAFIQQRIKLLLGGLPNVAPAEGWQGGRLHNFNQLELAKLLKKTGFNIISVQGSGFANHLRSIWPSLLSGDLIFLCERK